LALFAAYVTFTGIDGINIFKAPVLAMLFVGGMIPVVFSALAMNSVGKAAMDMVYEVRRQFKEIPVSWKEQVNQNMPNVLISLLKLLYAK
jgi:K(+)-stimulated pyrophosphate-energized sodium pump